MAVAVGTIRQRILKARSFLNGVLFRTGGSGDDPTEDPERFASCGVRLISPQSGSGDDPTEDPERPGTEDKKERESFVAMGTIRQRILKV